MRTVFTVAAAIGIVSLSGCFEPKKVYQEVALCAEPIKISACAAGTLYPTCTIENEAQVALSGNMSAWSYDKDGTQLGSPVMLSTRGLMPGQKKRLELIADGGKDNIAKIVVCSMDPQSVLMKGRVVSVGKAQ
ncbi:hypothetical protein GNX71_13005 [Variovorax sp. RKNM96]|uniref:hypothetical protein n=1 Tax=Variovorax sp. RKNM96 TaxID=2681552 RepID=UPI00197DB07A|nr:hypothetical protein [Variovorax sp. RKNM96]QSI30452.1 hypothetical protein GNX71_13005 [Variovorax sp. RKNM96]